MCYLQEFSFLFKSAIKKGGGGLICFASSFVLKCKIANASNINDMTIYFLDAKRALWTYDKYEAKIKVQNIKVCQSEFKVSILGKSKKGEGDIKEKKIQRRRRWRGEEDREEKGQGVRTCWGIRTSYFAGRWWEERNWENETGRDRKDIGRG